MDNVLEDIVIQVRRRFVHVSSFLLLINEGIPRFLATTRRLVLEREGDNLILHNYMESHDEEGLKHPHNKQVMNSIDWHVGVLDDCWYITPRFTYWYDEFRFERYTPDQLYSIIRMRIRTFHCLSRHVLSWPSLAMHFFHVVHASHFFK
jgi:hypothetical protein